MIVALVREAHCFSQPLPTPTFVQWVETAASLPVPASATVGVGECCMLPREPNRKRIRCILALKSVIWWQQFK